MNTLTEVVTAIDGLLGMTHVFTVDRKQAEIKYQWGDSNTNIELSITVILDGLVIVKYRHSLLPKGSTGLMISLDAPDINQDMLHLVGQCCHKFITVCPFCGL